MSGVGYRFSVVVLGGDVYFGGRCPHGCLFSGVPSIYGTFSLYSLFHRS